jgi:hypothetical protein
MTTTDPSTQVLASWDEPIAPDEAELAAMAFLARYSGRTLDAYRHDLRNLFQWAADHGLSVLEATRLHLGHCPCCDQPVAAIELLDNQEVTATNT